MAAAKKGKKESSTGLTAAEKAAMKATIQERKAAGDRDAGERAVKEALAKMRPDSRALGQRLHALITAAAPSLAPRTWYGMPAYASGDKVVVFFRNADKFKERYSTLGFNPEAKLDEGRMWPIAYALTELTSAEEAKVVALLKKAMG